MMKLYLNLRLGCGHNRTAFAEAEDVPAWVGDVACISCEEYKPVTNAEIIPGVSLDQKMEAAIAS
jgi:hypothetical protein